jgi:hypothetical protein
MHEIQAAPSKQLVFTQEESLNASYTVEGFCNNVDLKITARTRKVKIVSIVVLCFLLGNLPASEFYMPTFRKTLSVTSS